MVKKEGLIMIQEHIKDWKRLFKMYPDRYLKVYDKADELVEVHDTENGNIWFRIDESRWMFVN